MALINPNQGYPDWTAPTSGIVVSEGDVYALVAFNVRSPQARGKRRVGAIEMLRQRNPGLRLDEARAIVDKVIAEHKL